MWVGWVGEGGGVRGGVRTHLPGNDLQEPVALAGVSQS